MQQTKEKSVVKDLNNVCKPCWKRKRGCQYKCSDQQVRRKHEVWLCMYKDKCGMCGMDFSGRSSLEHHVQYHIDSQLTAVVARTEESAEAIVTWTIDIQRGHRYVVLAHKTLFLLHCDFSLKEISMRLVADVDGRGAAHFHVSYLLTSLCDHRTVIAQLSPDMDFICWDFCSNTALPIDFALDGCEATLTITKRQ